MLESTASANCCLDILQAPFGRTLVFARSNGCARVPWKPSRSLICPPAPNTNSCLHFYQSCPFKSELVIMALSKEINAFNIDAILASTADFTPQEFVLMQQFICHERGLKAYEDRF